MTTVQLPGASAASAALARRLRAVATLGGLVALAAGGFVWSVSIGPEHIGLWTIVKGTFAQGHDTKQLIVHLIRLPRALLAVLAGGTLAVSGAVMQSLTRNPLGAPDVLGVTSGAAVTVAIASTIVPSLGGISTIFLSFAGASVASALVFGIARFGRGGLSPVRLALAGVTISLLLYALMQGILIAFTQNAELFFFWLVGGVTYAQWHDIHLAFPWMAAGLALAMLLARRLNVLALGDDVARGLGQNVSRTRLLSVVCVVLLAGAAVGVAGPVAFLALVVPNIVRRLVGHNHFVVLPACMVAGAALLLYADVASRYLNPHVETPAGVVVAPIGATVFVYLARREKLAG
ncbi:MAG TPA: iron ABC transporter permease [Gaiellaceae bacterium]|nr:iron ABC transporter permease [Gaiellaceae bacterium]